VQPEFVAESNGALKFRLSAGLVIFSGLSAAFSGTNLCPAGFSAHNGSRRYPLIQILSLAGVPLLLVPSPPPPICGHPQAARCLALASPSASRRLPAMFVGALRLAQAAAGWVIGTNSRHHLFDNQGNDQIFQTATGIFHMNHHFQ
jgi:hypothetical protein